jgi:hypothetical protein
VSGSFSRLRRSEAYDQKQVSKFGVAMKIDHYYRMVAGAIALTALAVQYWLFVSNPANGGAVASTIAYFSFFTIIANWIGALTLLAPVVSPASRVGRFFSAPEVRTAATLYLALVAAVYHTVLAAQWDPQGWQLFTDIILHGVTPAAVTIDWLFFTQKRQLSLRQAPRWLIVPVAFGAWTLLRGAWTGTYPYTFLRVDELGYPAVLLNMTALFAAFAAGSAVLIVIGRRLPAPRST